MHRFHAEYHLNRNSGYYFLFFFLLFSLVSRFLQLFIVKLLVACFCKLITFTLAKTTESFFLSRIKFHGVNFSRCEMFHGGYDLFHGVKNFHSGNDFFTAWNISLWPWLFSRRVHGMKEKFHSHSNNIFPFHALERENSPSMKFRQATFSREGSHMLKKIYKKD